MVRAHSLRLVRPFVLSGLVLALAAMPADARKKESPVPPIQDEPALLNYLAGRVEACYDSARGGFVGRDGVPRAAAMRLGFLLSQDDPDNPWHGRAIATLDWTLGLRDTIGGGFLHAADDRALDIPSFHKRTDSNAERLELLLEGFEQTGNPVYRNQAAQVVDYFQRVLLAGRGGGTITTGRHVRYPTETPAANLLLALLERMEASVPTLGDSTRSLGGLGDA